MRNKNAGILMLIGGFVLLLGGLFAMGEIFSNNEYSDNLPCYDKMGNKIQGVTCSGEIISIEDELLRMIGFLIFFAGFSFILISVGKIIDGDED